MAPAASPGIHYTNAYEDDVWDADLSSGDEESPTLLSAVQVSPRAVSPVGTVSMAPAAIQSDSKYRDAGRQKKTAQFMVGSGNMKQRRIRLRVGECIGWRFVEAAKHRVDFKVCFVQTGMGRGDEIKVAPKGEMRLASHAGMYTARSNGELVLLFDNVSSWFKDKMIELELTRYVSKLETHSRQSSLEPASSPVAAPNTASQRVHSTKPDIVTALEPDGQLDKAADLKPYSEPRLQPEPDPEPEPEPTSELDLEPEPEPNVEPEPTLEPEPEPELKPKPGPELQGPPASPKLSAAERKAAKKRESNRRKRERQKVKKRASKAGSSSGSPQQIKAAFNPKHQSEQDLQANYQYEAQI